MQSDTAISHQYKNIFEMKKILKTVWEYKVALLLGIAFIVFGAITENYMLMVMLLIALAYVV